MKADEFLAITTVSMILVFKMAAAYTTGKTSFSVKCREDMVQYRIFGIFVLPGEQIDFEVSEAVMEGHYGFKAGSGVITKSENNKWRWQAPSKKGYYSIIITNPTLTDSMILNVFVMVPYQQLEGEYLNGYRIGRYPEKPLRNLEIYEPPNGFIEVTEQNQGIYISPHFQLKQFLCKQDSDFPKFVVLREKLLSKLEIVLERVNEAGYHCETFHVMSGYRTPYYNEVIKDVRYSRHIYGGAADIFIDVHPRDGLMDDLNGDGSHDIGDAMILYDHIDLLSHSPDFHPFAGGLGAYEKTPSHGPFVHVDVRGYCARWGFGDR